MDKLLWLKNNPKKAFLMLSSALLIAWLGYKVVMRTPHAINCTYQAVVKQSVPSDKWRYNWIDNECQYYNGTRWIQLFKVMDVGADVDELGG